MYVKPLIFVVGKPLLQYVLKCALRISLWRLKCYYSQRNSVETDRKNIVPVKLCTVKANISCQQKAIFSLNKYLPVQSTISTTTVIIF